MKSRQRFFNLAVFQKDITRFAPVWILYLIGGLMLAVFPLAEQGVDRNVETIHAYLVTFCLINLVYAAIVAQLLFGDLFNSRLGNALHAMPLRRECWFLTHITSGLLFSLVPNFIGCLAFIPFLGSVWYVSFLWLLAMTLQYLFFFGTAVLAVHCTGKGFAAFVVYGILNFGGLLLAWFAEVVYMPLLYGVGLKTDIFFRLTPVVWLFDREYFRLKHMQGCGCNYPYTMDTDYPHKWQFVFGNDWSYLILLALVGLVFLGLALLLYRRRKMETAGSFVAFKPMKPVFQVIFSLSAAGFCYLLPELFMGGDEGVMLVFFAIGLAVGFFVSQMLLDRSVKVLRKRVFLGFGVLVAAFGLSILLTWLDPVGITRRVPEAEQVEKVYVIKGHVSWDRLEKVEEYDITMSTTEPALIGEVCQAHSLALQDRKVAGNYNYGYTVTLHYRLKNGSTLTRFYTIDTRSEAYQTLMQIVSKPKMIFGFATWEEMKENFRYVLFQGEQIYNTALAEALWLDCKAGNLDGDYRYHAENHKEQYWNAMQLHLYDPVQDVEFIRDVNFYNCCTNTMAFLMKRNEGKPLDGNLEMLADSVSHIRWLQGGPVEIWEYPEIYSILDSMRVDMEYGYASYEAAGKDWMPMEVHYKETSGMESFKVYLDPMYSFTLSRFVNGNEP